VTQQYVYTWGDVIDICDVLTESCLNIQSKSTIQVEFCVRDFLNFYEIN